MEDHDPHPSSQSSTFFFQQAEWNAERTIREWIRKTLRETFLVTMKKHLTVLSSTSTSTSPLPPPRQPQPQQKRKSQSSKDDHQQQEQQDDMEDPSIVVRLDNLEGCLKVVQRLSEAWQRQLRKQNHVQTASWVEDVHIRGLSNLWSKPIRPSHPMPGREETISTTSTTSTSDDSKEFTDEDQHDDDDDEDIDDDDEMNRGDGSAAKLAPSTGGSSALVAATTTTTTTTPTHDGPVIPYCELRYLTRPHLRQPNPLQGPRDHPLNVFRQLGRQGIISYWPLDPSIIDDFAIEIPIRQRSERTTAGKKRGGANLHVQIIVPGKNAKGKDPMIEGVVEEEDDEEEQEESKRIFSQVLARTQSKINLPRFRRTTKRKLLLEEAAAAVAASGGTSRLTQQQQRRIQENIPRPPSSIDSTVFHIPTSSLSTVSEEEDAILRRKYLAPEVYDIDSTENATITNIFGFLEDLGTLHRRRQSKEKEGRSDDGTVPLLTEQQERRQDRIYLKERIRPRRPQKNLFLRNMKSKILRTEEQDTTTMMEDDGEIPIMKSFLDFDLGWTLVEYTNPMDGQRKLMIFSSLQVTVIEEDPS